MVGTQVVSAVSTSKRPSSVATTSTVGQVAVEHRTLPVDECSDLAGGDAREQPLLGVLVGAGEQGLGGHQRGQRGRRDQRAAHLLERDQRLEEGEPGAAVLLRDAERRRTDLLAERLPRASS